MTLEGNVALTLDHLSVARLRLCPHNTILESIGFEQRKQK